MRRARSSVFLSKDRQVFPCQVFKQRDLPEGVKADPGTDNGSRFFLPGHQMNSACKAARRVASAAAFGEDGVAGPECWRFAKVVDLQQRMPIAVCPPGTPEHSGVFPAAKSDPEERVEDALNSPDSRSGGFVNEPANKMVAGKNG